MPEWARRWVWELLLEGILIGVWILNVSLSPFYLGVQNVINTFQLSIEKVIVAVIMAFVIVNGEIDLSVASVMAFSACTLAALHDAGVPFGLAVVVALAGIVLHRTAFGLSVYVIGNNANVARYSGLGVGRTKLILLTTSGFVAGLAGVLFAARLGSVRGDLALGFELDIITMVLLGGVSIFGGSGSIVGVALAILIVLNLRNGLGLANCDQNTQRGVIG